MGCALPLNDKYGTQEQQFVEPDALYQSTGVGSGIGITTKAEEKDLEALFAMFNWMYTEEGGRIQSLGLSKEQYEATEFDRDVYKENDIPYAYDIIENDDGTYTYRTTFNATTDMTNAMRAQRLTVGLTLTGKTEDGHYTIDRQANDKNGDHAIAEFVKYTNTGTLSDYIGKMSEDESDQYTKTTTSITDYCNQTIPQMIKDGLKEWDQYVEKVNGAGVKDICPIFQKYVDEVKGY